MKSTSIAFLLVVPLFVPLLVQAGDFGRTREIVSCKGSVLQRRFALVQFGHLVDAYITAKGSLPDICAAPPTEILSGVPELLKDNSVCGSSREGAVHYACQLPLTQSANPSDNSPVIESCRYSLLDQSVSCENRSVVTTFENHD